MALASGSLFQITATATTGNVNGAGFNPNSANFLTDLATSTGTSSTPSVTSASYSFVSGDIGSWLYIKSGTNWTPGWYQISSVATGAATVNAAIGAAVSSINAQGVVTYNATAGVGTSSSLTSGTYGVDYSQQDSPVATSTTATSSGAGSVILFAGSTQSMLGNFVQIISGTNATAGWYEIIAETAGVSITTDRASTTGIGAAITMNIGGAGRLNGLEDAFQAMLPVAAIVFVKNGSYTLSGAISTSSGNGTGTNPIFWLGFNSRRGDICNGTNRPTIVAAANAVQFSSDHLFYNFQFTLTSTGINFRGGTMFTNCKCLNSSTTAGRAAFSSNISSGSGIIIQYVGTEATAQNGSAFSGSNGLTMGAIGCYGHDSNIIFNNTGGGTGIFIGNISESSTSAAFLVTNFSGTMTSITNNTMIGRAGATPVGTGISMANSNTNSQIYSNNIILGFSTGVSNTTGNANTNMSIFNDFFGNTTDVTFFLKGSTDLAVNPSFTSESEVAGTVGQGLAGSLFQDTTKNFTSLGVVANQDFLHIVSGGSLTAGCYLITAITTTTNPNDTLTLNNSPGTGAASAVYWITVGHNVTPTNTSLIGGGFPNFTNTSNNNLLTSYPTIGAVQPKASSGGGGTVGYAYA